MNSYYKFKNEKKNTGGDNPNTPSLGRFPKFIGEFCEKVGYWKVLENCWMKSYFVGFWIIQFWILDKKN